MTSRKPGKNFTFWSSALDPTDRLQYPPVSLFFGMCSCSQTRRGVQENLFDIEFLCTIGRLLGAKLAWLTNLEMTNSWPNMQFPKGNPDGMGRNSGPTGSKFQVENISCSRGPTCSFPRGIPMVWEEILIPLGPGFRSRTSHVIPPLNRE